MVAAYFFPLFLCFPPNFFLQVFFHLLLGVGEAVCNKAIIGTHFFVEYQIYSTLSLVSFVRDCSLLMKIITTSTTEMSQLDVHVNAGILAHANN